MKTKMSRNDASIQIEESAAMVEEVVRISSKIHKWKFLTSSSLFMAFQEEQVEPPHAGVEMFIFNDRLVYSLSPNGVEPFYWAGTGDRLTEDDLQNRKNLDPLTAMKLNSLEYLRQQGRSFITSAERDIQQTRIRLSSHPRQNTDYRDPNVFQRLLDSITLFNIQNEMTKLCNEGTEDTRIKMNLCNGVLKILTGKIDKEAEIEARNAMKKVFEISGLQVSEAEFPEIPSYHIIEAAASSH